MSTREHSATVPLRVRLHPLNRILSICGRAGQYHVHLPEVGGFMPPCPRGDQDGDDNVECCTARLSVGPCVHCARVACSSALRSFARGCVFITPAQTDW